MWTSNRRKLVALRKERPTFIRHRRCGVALVKIDRCDEKVRFQKIQISIFLWLGHLPNFRNFGSQSIVILEHFWLLLVHTFLHQSRILGVVRVWTHQFQVDFSRVSSSEVWSKSICHGKVDPISLLNVILSRPLGGLWKSLAKFISVSVKRGKISRIVNF